MEYVYHGSNTPNLKIIKRNKSTHNKYWIYATYSKAISTIFLSPNHSDLFYSLSGNGIDTPVCLVERKPGMFKNIFNASGSIYYLDKANFKENMTGWSAELVSDKDEKVRKEEHIDNIYNKLVELSKDGELQLYLYPERPDWVPLDNSDLIPKVKRWEKNGFDIKYFFNIYPELKDRYNDYK